MRMKNLFTTRSFSPLDEDSIVFISYRRTIFDRHMAWKSADILEDIPGLHYWLDEDDACMQQAHAHNDDVQKALCIEKGLDASSALLGIIGPETFDSPWIPYEIGGARGRQRFAKPFALPPSVPHPLIAHLIHDVETSKVPAFIGLGIPLVSLEEVKHWAKSVAEMLQSRPLDLSAYSTKRIQDRHGIHEIYHRNTRYLKLSEL